MTPFHVLIFFPTEPHRFVCPFVRSVLYSFCALHAIVASVPNSSPTYTVKAFNQHHNPAAVQTTLAAAGAPRLPSSATPAAEVCGGVICGGRGLLFFLLLLHVYWFLLEVRYCAAVAAVAGFMCVACHLRSIVGAVVIVVVWIGGERSLREVARCRRCKYDRLVHCVRRCVTWPPAWSGRALSRFSY